MADYIFSSEGKESSTTLLFFRALCDLGVALRFLLYRVINQHVCGKDTCTVGGMLQYAWLIFPSCDL